MAIVRSELTRRAANRMALFAVGTLLATSGAIVALALTHRDRTWLGMYLALPAAIGVVWLALRRRHGRRRFALLLDAYALAATPLVALNVEVGSHWGAYLFVGAYASFAFVRVARRVALLLRRRRGDASNVAAKRFFELFTD